ncbi:hypothetical protein [Nocardia cyriacigeorgica]|uniref:hypothetical protein n=1 Tax=Nocardia cyriacigeorgica TaxID=135487 RepID=UPI0018933B35|nr:hypothetical protein [Nocardia cyriacigeorgica]MBF6416862.1 hypothetical protein [Nocardia cyriacigeorgica]
MGLEVESADDAANRETAINGGVVMMQLVSGVGTEDNPVKRSAWYVGQNRWSMLWLPGRTVSTECAVAAIRVAEIMDGCPGSGDPVWPSVRSDLNLLGYTAREFAALLGFEWQVPDALPERSQRIGFWPPRTGGRHG